MRRTQQRLKLYELDRKVKGFRESPCNWVNEKREEKLEAESFCSAGISCERVVYIERIMQCPDWTE